MHEVRSPSTYSRNASPIIRYVSFAASCAFARGPSDGASSVTSKPTMRRLRATVSSSSLTSSQWRPPGSGVPTADITDESNASRSNVRYTSSESWSASASAPSARYSRGLVEAEALLDDVVVLLALGAAQADLGDRGDLRDAA